MKILWNWNVNWTLCWNDFCFCFCFYCFFFSFCVWIFFLFWKAETICHCRRKRSNYVSGSGIHQSYYFNKGNYTPTRLHRQAISLDIPSRSDEDTHHTSYVINGNGILRDSIKKQLIDEGEHLEKLLLSENESA